MRYLQWELNLKERQQQRAAVARRVREQWEWDYKGSDLHSNGGERGHVISESLSAPKQLQCVVISGSI